jgi:hypothetical protein
MADELWSKEAFANGYSSGTVVGPLQDGDPETELRLFEDKRIGGSLSEFFESGVRPYLKPDSRVLEFGPGKGSWTRALFSEVTSGQIHTVDLQDIRPWVQDLIDQCPGRFFTHQVPFGEAVYGFLKDDYFDVFFSFGVFCHMDLDALEKFLVRIKPKLKKEALCIAEYSDWEKGLPYCISPEGREYNKEGFSMLEEQFPFEFDMLKCSNWVQKLGPLWKKYVSKGYPAPSTSPERSFWVRNNRKTMKKIFERTGYEVLNIDMDFFRRDPVALFRPAL